MSFDALREECCEANKSLPRHHLVDITFGNVSVLNRDAAIFAIKPSGVPYADLTPADMVLVDLEGKKVEGRHNPSSDTETHRCLFRAFDGVRSIVHTHSRNAVAFAQAGRAIPCFGTTHADYFHGGVPITRPLSEQETASAYEWETGRVIVERFRGLSPVDFPGVLVPGHGPFAWGTSGAVAVENALALEIIAEMALNTLAINPGASPLAQHLLDKHFLRKHGPSAYYGQPGSK